MIGRIHSSQLDEYVAQCDALGGIWTPECKEFVADFELFIDSEVDRSLDPFSEEYFVQQLAVYKEISGRELDQSTNELHPFDYDKHANGVNPYNSRDAAIMTPHVSAAALALKMAQIPEGGKVLDMGVGMGLSSEVMAYCGAEVTAVDINPEFIALIEQRAAQRGLPITGRVSNFDDFDDIPETYDLAAFFGSLHHGLRPWKILENLTKFIRPDGKIALIMEPIQKSWWPYWGLRLDSESAYVARKFGWFESGFSEEFLQLTFQRMGYSLDVRRHDAEIFAGGIFCIGMKSPTVSVEQYPYMPVLERGQKTLFCSGSVGKKYLSFGWSESEPWGTWSDGSSAGLLLNLPHGESWTITIEAHPMVSPSHLVQELDITLNKTPLGKIMIQAEEGSFTMQKSSTFKFRFSKNQIDFDASKPAALEFAFPFATRPDYIGRGNDPRKIAIGIVSLTID